MAWRLAKSLAVLRGEVNARAPQRSKASDGTLGDQAHAARRSDHNPDADGVVCAIDITDDPAHGHDDRVFAEHLRQLGAAGDKRVKYVISNGRIAGPSTRGWGWRTYTGINAHDKHTHLSVSADATHYDSTAPWGWFPPPTPKEFDAMATRDEIKQALREVLSEDEFLQANTEGTKQYYIRERDGIAVWVRDTATFTSLARALPSRAAVPDAEIRSRYEVA